MDRYTNTHNFSEIKQKTLIKTSCRQWFYCDNLFFSSFLVHIIRENRSVSVLSLSISLRNLSDDAHVRDC